MINIKDIGERIKASRKEKGYTLEELSEKCNCTRQTVSQWEKGKVNLTIDEYVKLCNHLDCDIGYLIGEHKTKRRVTADLKAITGLSEKAVNILIEANKDCFKEGEISKLTFVLNILIESCGINLIAYDTVELYKSFQKCKAIKENPNYKEPTFKDFSKKIDNAKNNLTFKIEPIDYSHLSDTERKEELKRVKKATKEFILKKNEEMKNEQEAALLHSILVKEEQEEQPVRLFHLQKTFLGIIEKSEYKETQIL